MRFSRIQIYNFRNFENLDFSLSEHAVIVGENKIGKSNFIYALRLLLDPTLPDSARELREEDFWDGLERPLSKKDQIQIRVEISDFEDNQNLLAMLAEYLIAAEPMKASLTYIFRPLQSLESAPSKAADFEFVIFGGDNTDNNVNYDLRRRLPIDVFPALRDAESDLANWRRSPLRPLIEKAAETIDKAKLIKIADKVSLASSEITAIPEIDDLDSAVTDRLKVMVGASHAVDVSLGLNPVDPDRLVRSLRLFIDNNKRGISEASLGSANLIYLALKSLELQQLVQQGDRDHTFLAIEEPEAHLHPHLQRLVYRDFLQPRLKAENNAADEKPEVEVNRTILLTTHSPHIVSVTPLKSLVLLHKSQDKLSTSASSTAELNLNDKDIADLERYLDVTRGEIVFSRGVLLVEGDAECFLVPILAKLNGFDFDKLGITVCSVSGTNFMPYIKFLGPKGLNLPFAVITDRDPIDGRLYAGDERVVNLLNEHTGTTVACENEAEFFALAKSNGFFLNDYTLEVDLFHCGRTKSTTDTISDLSTNGAAKKRAEMWKVTPTSLDPVQFLKDIEAIGKGRFAQRLATRIRGKQCPKYILQAIEFIIARCD